MDGMHSFSGWAKTTGSDEYTISDHWEVPPLNCMVQTMITGVYEFDDQTNAAIYITGVDYLDQNGVTRHDDYSGTIATVSVYYPSLVRFDWAMQVSSCGASYILNVFEWGAYV